MKHKSQCYQIIQAMLKTRDFETSVLLRLKAVNI